MRHLVRIGCVLVMMSAWSINYCAEIAKNTPDTNHVGETLVLIKAGETGVLSYGLHRFANNSSSGPNRGVSGSLILFFRNVGAKSINFEHVTVEDFALQDSQGRNIRLYLWTPPRTIGFRDPTVIHLVADYRADAVPPCTLRFRSKPNSFVPIDISIAGIQPPEDALGPKRSP